MTPLTIAVPAAPAVAAAPTGSSQPGTGTAAGGSFASVLAGTTVAGTADAGQSGAAQSGAEPTAGMPTPAGDPAATDAALAGLPAAADPPMTGAGKPSGHGDPHDRPPDAASSLAAGSLATVPAELAAAATMSLVVPRPAELPAQPARTPAAETSAATGIGVARPAAPGTASTAVSAGPAPVPAGSAPVSPSPAFTMPVTTASASAALPTTPTPPVMAGLTAQQPSTQQASTQQPSTQQASTQPQPPIPQGHPGNPVMTGSPAPRPHDRSATDTGGPSRRAVGPARSIRPVFTLVTPTGSSAPATATTPADTLPAATANLAAPAGTIAVQQPVLAQTGGTPSPAHAPSAPPTEPAQVTRQLAGPVLSLRTAGDGNHQLTIALHPAELGPVNVHVRILGDSMTIQLASTSEGAHDALREALPQLRQELQAAGLPSVDLSLDLGGSAAGGFGAQADPRTDQGTSGYAGDRMPSDRPAPSTPLDRPARHPDTGLDRWL